VDDPFDQSPGSRPSQRSNRAGQGRAVDRLRPISEPATSTAPPPPPPRVEILGVPLAVSDYDEVVAWMDAMIAARARGSVTAAAVNLIMSARDDPATMRAVLSVTLAVPDGQPLVWALRLLGNKRATRVYGPDLMEHYCARAATTGTPMYLYGGRSEEALALLTGRLRKRFPGLRIVGGWSPPFRPLTG
jgi:N-acetylglucosaminyldiphosphoundecaprenol N-acetyl-beta-D-mannosaminyltransferase